MVCLRFKGLSLSSDEKEGRREAKYEAIKNDKIVIRGERVGGMGTHRYRTVAPECSCAIYCDSCIAKGERRDVEEKVEGRTYEPLTLYMPKKDFIDKKGLNVY